LGFVAVPNSLHILVLLKLSSYGVLGGGDHVLLLLEKMVGCCYLAIKA
jgi:hypothetical protein